MPVPPFSELEPNEAPTADGGNGPQGLARSAALDHAVTREHGASENVILRLDQARESLFRARVALATPTSGDPIRDRVAEWTLDNFHLLQKVMREIPKDIPPGFYRKLPVLSGGPFRGLPRIFAMARLLVERNRAQVTSELLEHFITEYQTITPLTTGELWALAPILRLGLIETLAALIDSLLIPGLPPERPLPDVSIDIGVANCIGSLQLLDILDWRDLHENVSLVETGLRKDPSGIYRRMDLKSRSLYREAIENLADLCGKDEITVVDLAIKLSQERVTGGADPSARVAHVGYFLVDQGRESLEERLGCRPRLGTRLARAFARHPGPTVLGPLSVLALFFEALAVAYAWVSGANPIQLSGVAALGFIPAVTLAVSVFNFIATRLVPPRVLPKLDMRQGLPEEARTLMAVPAMLTKKTDVNTLLQQLELHYLRNPLPNLWIVALTDYADAPAQHMPEDQLLLDHARAEIATLNARYAANDKGPFLLLHRERRWNASEGVWMGWERKRGKLEELNQLILGLGDTSYTTFVGNLDVLRVIKYVITLDVDSMLPQNGAARLVGTIAHPLNRAEFDPATNKVVAGYTVLQPRPEILPTRAIRTRFAHVFAGDVGLDLYTRAVSDVYQDLFGEGIYVGKGVYDVAAFHRSTAGRIPENTVLSHDLLESILGRAGLVTDVVIFEDFPSNHFLSLQRLHRWIRGDWQLLPYLLPRVPHARLGAIKKTLGPLALWQIADNLRRSLLEVSLVAMLLAGWFWFPGRPAVWTVLAVTVPMIPLLTGAFVTIARGRVAELDPDLRALHGDILRWIAALFFMPYEAVLKAHAIGITLYRLFISRRRLLQWTTAAETATRFGDANSIGAVWRKMWYVPCASIVLLTAIMLLRPDAMLVAVPLLFGWLLSPQFAWWLARPRFRATPRLNAPEQARLRRLARRTWFFFERFVGPEDHWLPPDHFQEFPKGETAHRTSPTNIGLYLLSTLSAYHMGFTDVLGFTARIKSTFASLERMEKYQGHFLNWYDTHTLSPLPPRYVSSVDSGNLAACLLALRQGCAHIPTDTVPRSQYWEGLVDTLGVAGEFVNTLVAEGIEGASTLAGDVRDIQDTIPKAIDMPDACARVLGQLIDRHQPALQQNLAMLLERHADRIDPSTVHNLNTWSKQIKAHLSQMRREVAVFTPWTLKLEQPPQLFVAANEISPLYQAWNQLQTVLPAQVRLCDVGTVCEQAAACLANLIHIIRSEAHYDTDRTAALHWCEDFRDALPKAATNAGAMIDACRKSAEAATQYFERMDFHFLFDSHRSVLRIGYNVDAKSLDPNCYDLLASEARVTSLLVIAKGDAPMKHWLHLSRPVTRIGARRALMSWNGSMFEYLMPALLTRMYPQTFLDESINAAVEAQIEFGKRHGIPWGVSESGYYRFDANLNYQYRGFGLQCLGFKRGLDEDLVVTPYASILALGVRPFETINNLDAFEKLGLLGDYGLYEAIDFTPERLPRGEVNAPIRSFMAHHQGMILVSLANYLKNDVIIDEFHHDSVVRTTELFLQERVPLRAPLEQVNLEKPFEFFPPVIQATATSWSVPARTLLPYVHVLTNGRLGTMITNRGSGYSVWRGRDVTRWYPDTTLDECGTWIYLQDCESGRVWSLSEQPIPGPQRAETHFSPHRVDFQCAEHGISALMALTIDPNSDVEIRRVNLTNDSARPRTIRLTTYAELALATRNDDHRHPAFSKLFVESRFDPDANMLTMSRRTIVSEDRLMHVAFGMLEREHDDTSFEFETDRRAFLGRMRGPRDPAMLSSPDSKLSSTYGRARDPIAALQKTFVIEPHESVNLAILMAVAESRAKASAAAASLRDWTLIQYAFDRARSHVEVEMQKSEITALEIQRFQQLLSPLIYPHRALRAEPEVLSENTKGQSGLWGYDISGDYPVLLVKVSGDGDAGLLPDVLRAHRYWRSRDIKIDLVILDESASSYSLEEHGKLHRLFRRMGADVWIGQPGGVFFLRQDTMDRQMSVLLNAAASVILESCKGSIEEQLAALHEREEELPVLETTNTGGLSLPMTPPLVRPDDLLFDNGLGGFSPDGREYVMYLGRDNPTPAPWVNVIANPEFGCLISESGTGFTWSINSGENRLTSWSNDPVRDLGGEALYLRDEEIGRIWSPTPGPAGDDEPYLVRHGAGYSTFEHNSLGLEQCMEVFVAHDAPVKIIRLRVKNVSPRVRRLTATYYAEWVLGVKRENLHSFLVPSYDHETRALLAHNSFNDEFSARTAFLAASRTLHGLTADRSEFLGNPGNRRAPNALRLVGLSGRVEPGLDPCAAVQVHLDIEPDEVKELYFLLGQEESRDAALRLINRYQEPGAVETAWERSREVWNSFLGRVEVDTPDPAMNTLLNRWLVYQSLSCRLWGRSALYQSSGAYGFRDQLQDVMGLILHDPKIARAHILRAARHQFEQGDVLHWWHPPSPRGVRTRITDDLLWLPHVTAHYIASTGDVAILEERLPFLRGEQLKPDERERYGVYGWTETSHSLYEHCMRAIARGSTRGPHGLPLMGGGDWNDSMNRVGTDGRGESIWLGWFLYSTLMAFSPLCENMKEHAHAIELCDRAQRLRESLENSAWDGEWYLRAFYDDGQTLGSRENRECWIDSIAQSWAVLSDAAQPERAKQAMEAVYRELVKPDDRLILLFTPPFDTTNRNPGYVKKYPPGVRENGGQYTHAATWAAFAFACIGDGDRAEELFRLLNPIYQARDNKDLQKYRVEPYVIAADVYFGGDYTGRGGWTWYTGASAWMYRLGVEIILGVRRCGDGLRIDPTIPKSWPAFSLVYRYGTSSLRIRVENPEEICHGVGETIFDGESLSSSTVPLIDDGNSHTATLVLKRNVGRVELE